MTKPSILFNYLKDRFDDEIKILIFDYIKLNHYKSKEKQQYSLEENFIQIHMNIFKILLDDTLEFDEVMISFLCDVTGISNSYNNNSNPFNNCLKVTLMVDIANKTMKVKSSTCTLYELDINESSQCLVNNLIPIIEKKKLDDIARLFLSKYYNKALDNDEAINLHELLSILNLTLIESAIKSDGSIFGQICFDDLEVSLYNKQEDLYEFRKVKKGTIIS